MRKYNELFKKNKQQCAQLLLTWDDFDEAANEISGLSDEIFGFAMDGWWGPWGYWVNAAGSGFFNEDYTACGLNNNATVEGLSFVADLVDEGAALQVDFRPQYTEITELNKVELDRVTALDSPDKFWSRDEEQNIKNYQSAKVAVAKLFKEHSPEFLYTFLEKISEGESFKEVVNYEN